MAPPPRGEATRASLGILDAKPPMLAPSFVKNGYGASLVKDPETGFLTPGPTYQGGSKDTAFNASRKVKFLELAKDMYPNLSGVCELVGVSTGTFKNHLAIDEAFRQALEDLKERVVDSVEANMFAFSRRPQNFMDRMAIMRAYRGELYNPKSTVTFKHEISPEDATRRRANLAGAIDAELVEASTQVLEAEVAEEKFQVPGPASASPIQAPVGGDGGDGHSLDLREKAPGARDPLLDLGE